MNLLGYTTGRIEFQADGDLTPTRNFSDRSILHLYYHDSNEYSLNALDLDNNKAEIFHIYIRRSNQYNFAEPGESDSISNDDGTYRLWLNAESRSGFHETLRAILEILEDNRSSISSNAEDEPVNSATSDSDENEVDEPQTPNPIGCEPQNLLTDIHKLSEAIKNGQSDEAARIATQLASKNLRLQGNQIQRAKPEDEFEIRVQFDGDLYNADQHGGTIPITVFPSTTVRELRATFELAYNYQPSSQYFFANGNLVHDSSTMKELQVGPNSLFILFLLEHQKKFSSNNPWVCSACERQNQPNTHKCIICSATRSE